MTAQFPTAIVSTSNIPDALPLSTLSANNHAGKHNDLRDEIIAIETKIGATGSVVNTTLEFKTKNITGGDQAVGATQTVSMSNKTLVSPKVTVTSDAIGDVLYNSSGATGVQSRLALGTTGQVLTSNGTLPYWSSPSGTNVNYIADSGAANAYVAILTPALAAYTAGVLVQFKATNANTTASTVNVNGLGVKTIKKGGGATDLASGDIAAGMIVQLEYDGTNFIMLNPVAGTIAFTAGAYPSGTAGNITSLPIIFKNGVTTWADTNSSSTQTIAHGLGVIPKFVRLNVHYALAFSATVSYVASSVGCYNGTTNSCVYSAFTFGNGAGSNAITSSTSNTQAVYIQYTGTAGNTWAGIVTVDATNISIAWTRVGSFGGNNLNIVWEAQSVA